MSTIKGLGADTSRIRGFRATVGRKEGPARQDDPYAGFRPTGRAFATEESLPSPSLLEKLIGHARDALANGIAWERGSIVNFLL